MVTVWTCEMRATLAPLNYGPEILRGDKFNFFLCVKYQRGNRAKSTFFFLVWPTINEPLAADDRSWT
jgi:hypothetical protein